jgi:predicted helicase
MYAQTIAYGLLAARVSRPAGIVADNLADMVPITNPFLKDMLGTFLSIGGRKGKIDFDELGIQEVVDLLNSPDTHMEAILRDFGKRTMQEDPVIHFYELFLKEYDRKKKVERGVFYTPQPVVSYIVRSVDELLKKEFGLEDGLASTITWGEMAKRNPNIKIPEGVSPDEHFVQMLDPATGTATFLVEIIEVVYQTMLSKWRKEKYTEFELGDLWNVYVSKHLLPRLYGFELMMAPYAIAHMKIGLKLYETGYKFRSDERAHIYLTNSLEPPSDMAEQPEFEEWSPALAHEAKAVNAVKRKKRFTVVVGNPPYSYMSANLTEVAANLIEPFRYVDGERIRERGALSLERSLQDDFVKFFGLALRLRVETGPSFVLGFITNNSYMDSPLHRGVRGRLISDFGRLWIINLFGDSIKDREENVFEIQQGVAICIGVAIPSAYASIDVAEFHGSRNDKYLKLSESTWKTTQFIRVNPSAPQRYFLNLENICEYSSWPSLSDVFKVTSTCIKTHKDKLATGFDSTDVVRKIDRFRDLSTSRELIESEFGVDDNAQWKVEPARRALRELNLDDYLAIYQARPFDYRWMFYHDAIVESPRREVMSNLVDLGNRALIANRKIRTGNCNHFWVTSHICVSEIISSADNSNCYPLYILHDDHGLQLGEQRQMNLSWSFLKKLSSALGIPQCSTLGLPQGINPDDIFDCIYAIVHSPTYRSRYADLLKIEFPRLPLPTSIDLFHALVRLGSELVYLHLMKLPKLNKYMSRYIGKDTPEVEKISYSDNTVWIDKAKTEGFQGVPENVWSFHIGSYQVCEKWLKDRKGRQLSTDDINHYHRIVVALNETIRIMAEIDKVIEQHGGWPGAFQSKEEEKKEYKVQTEPIQKVAEKKPEHYTAKSSTIISKQVPSSKNDWQTWLELSKWVKETMSINTFWINFAQDISHKLKQGARLTDKEKTDMKKCWEQAVKKGFEV